MSRTRLVVRLVLIFLLLAVVGLVVWFYFFRTSTQQYLVSGETSYVAGVKALDSEDAATALLRFEEATLQAKRVLDQVEDRLKKNPELSEEKKGQLEFLRGKAFWLNAISLREHAYAKALAEKKPLRKLVDPLTGEKFRTIRVIPDPKKRVEAMLSLRNAALRLTDSTKIQQAALRFELPTSKLNWPIVQTVCKNLIKLEPKNHRALLTLARFEFEQPITTSKDPLGTATPLAKRRLSRVQESLKYLETAMAVEGAPYWRMLHLKAQIHEWLMKQAEGNVGETNRQAAILRRLYEEALTKAARSEHFKSVGALDRTGALELHVLALEQKLREVRDKSAQPAEIKGYVEKTLAFCQKAPDLNSVFTPGTVAETTVKTLAKAQTFLSLSQPEWWQKQLEEVKTLARKAAKEKQGAPELYTTLADLIRMQAQLAGRDGNAKESKKLRDEALQWIETGLQVADAQTLSAQELFELNQRAAGMKLMLGKKRNDIVPHLQALAKIKSPRTQILVALLEGVGYAQEGRLEKARTILEQVLQSNQGDLVFLAHTNLANIYSSLGKPSQTLTSLRNLAAFYKNFDDLTAQEKAWANEFIGDFANVQARMVAAHLDTALLKVADRTKKNPGTKISFQEFQELTGFHEKATEKLLQDLPSPSPQDQRARSKYTTYLLRLGRLKEAREEVLLLRKDYPASVEALRLEATLIQLEKKKADPKSNAKLDAKTIAVIDQKIQKFLKTNTDSLGGRFLWTIWLTQTDREDKALDYLKDPLNFPDAKSQAYRALVAVVLHKTGKKEESIEAFQLMKPSPQLFEILIRLGTTLEEKEKHVTKALERYENAGRFLCWNATLKFNRGQFDEAVREFHKAADVTRVQSWAERGLQQSLFALARQDPRKAKQLADELLGSDAKQPAVLLGYAYSCLLLDELGNPKTDTWVRAKNMATALKTWESLTAPKNQILGQTDVVEAEFWILANRLDLARPKILFALNDNPKHPRALELATRLAIELSDHELLNESSKWLDTLQELQPKSNGPAYLRAQVLEHQKKHKEAIELYQKILKKAPKYANAYPKLVALLEEEKKFQEAMTWVKLWRKEYPDAIAALQAEVRVLAKEGKIAEADKSVDQYLLTQQKQFEKRWADLKKPKNMTAREMAQRKKQALAQIRKAVLLRGCIGFLQAEKNKETEERVKALLKDDPDWVPGLLVLANNDLARKAMPAARTLYEKILKKIPTHYIASNNLAWLLAQDLNEPRRALEIATRVRHGRFSKKPLPGNRLQASFLDTLGVIYHKLGDKSLYPEMRDLFTEAIARHPNDPRMYLFLGHAYAGLGERFTAGRYYKAAAAKAENTFLLSEEDRKKVLDAVAKAK